ncbi:cold-regulated 47 [Actinidia rufa]|uniref:Cold-regulated 47 n=1 Tax=Actinidia rufa TaxID=165716 RepID=A0A7J0E0D1_9ERIC|nr:cold-regulated 47 [Actinidia rufa]
MAEECHHHHHEEAVETKDRGLFDFIGKKEEEKKPNEEEDVIASELEKVHLSEPEKEEEEKHGLAEKLHRSDSSSSSSSDEEFKGEGAEKEEEKEGFKGKDDGEDIRREKEEKHEEECTSIPIEIDQPEEKKGFLQRIKEKLPGQYKKTEEATLPASECEGEPKEKKGIFGEDQREAPWVPPQD